MPDDNLAIGHRRDGVLIGTMPHLVVYRICRQSMNQIKFLLSDRQLKMSRQAAQKLQHLLPFRLVQTGKTLQCGGVSIAVPVLDVLFRCIRCKISQAHKFMVAQQHLHVGCAHDFLQDFHPMRSSVDHISQDIQGILRREVDFFQHCLPSVVLSVDIRNNIV